MNAISLPLAAPSAAAAGDATDKQHIRGSVLLLVGRMLSLALNFGVQVLTVRYLSKSDYGALAYALALVSLGSSLAVFGMDKAVTRFVPIYQERRDYHKLFGTIVMMTATVLGIGLAIVSLVIVLRAVLARYLVSDALAVELLLIVIALVPVQALDSLCIGLFASFTSARAIFFRRHLLGPTLKLAAVLVVVLSRGNVYLLAAGHLAAGLLGVTIYPQLLYRILRDQDLVQQFKLQMIKMPAREVFGFSLPLLSSDLLFLLRGSLVILVLEFFHSSSSVAEFRAVVPVAMLNQVVFGSFRFLFTPIASRMFAREDRSGINELYWRTAMWITVLSLPVFLVSFALAEPLTILLFGERYAASGTILALLSFGYFFNAALGFNALTLRVFGKVGYLVRIDLLAAVTALVANLMLIPRFGAVGGAVGTCATLVVHNILCQLGLRLGTGIRPLDWRCLQLYLMVGLGAAGVLMIQMLLAPPIYVGVGVSAVICVLVLRFNRHLLEIDKMFPELLRVPLIRWFLARPDGSGHRAPKANVNHRPRCTPNVFAQHLRERAASYFDEFRQKDVDAELLEQRNRAVCTLYRYRLHSGALSRLLVVKVPRPIVRTSGGTNSTAASPYRRPRRTRFLDPQLKCRLEYAALCAIHDHFQRLGDPRFGTVRAFDILPEYNALVMEDVQAPNLSRLFARVNRLQRNYTGRPLDRAFRNAGAWLRAYHGIAPRDTVESCQSERPDFTSWIAELTEYLTKSAGDERFFQRIAAGTAKWADEALPVKLPLGLSHRDYAMRNILVAAGDRVIVLDTQAKYFGPIYEDIGYFLAGLKTTWPQVYSQGLIFSSRQLARYADEFLMGYFGQHEFPREAIRLYEIQSLLNKWTAAVERLGIPASAGGLREWPRRCAGKTQLALIDRFYRRHISSLLLNCG